MNAVTRKNTAIMFTDVVGYSRMMEADELSTFQLMLQLRVILDQVHDKHDGILMEFIGDGSLSTFDSAERAVRAAIELRQLVPQHLGFHLRIGLHYGAVIRQGTNTGGHAINLASRIEDSADADSIFLSKNVLDQLDQPESYKIVKRGKYRFKNVKERMELFSIDSKPSNSDPIRSSSFMEKWASFVTGLALFLGSLTGLGSTTSSSSGMDFPMVQCQHEFPNQVHCESESWLAQTRRLPEMILCCKLPQI